MYPKHSFKKIQSHFCGELLELMDGKDYPVSIVIGDEMKPTVGHYHITNDEIYVCIDGVLHIDLYDPISNEKQSVVLQKYESIVIERGIHHKITKTENCKLLTMCIPNWTPEGERKSDVLI